MSSAAFRDVGSYVDFFLQRLGSPSLESLEICVESYERYCLYCERLREGSCSHGPVCRCVGFLLSHVEFDNGTVGGDPLGEGSGGNTCDAVGGAVGVVGSVSDVADAADGSGPSFSVCGDGRRRSVCVSGAGSGGGRESVDGFGHGAVCESCVVGCDVAEVDGAAGVVDGRARADVGGGVSGGRGLGAVAGEQPDGGVGSVRERDVVGASKLVGGGDEFPRGPNWSRNDAARKRRKEKKMEKKEKNPNTELRLSLEAKWKAENELAVLKAKKEKAVLEACDVETEVKKKTFQNKLAVERCMVSMEKVHSSLRASGNVAGEFPGSVETVVSGPGLSVGSGTISPNSSVSEAEVRKLQKDVVDMAKDLDDARRILKRFGLDKAKAEDYEKSLWTMNEDCQLPVDSFEKLESMYPDGYVYDPSYGDRARVTPVFD